MESQIQVRDVFGRGGVKFRPATISPQYSQLWNVDGILLDNTATIIDHQ